MPTTLATIIFAIGIIGLFLLDRGEKNQVSKALWIPTAWLFITISRSVSQWLGIDPAAGDSASVYLEGSPVDRDVFAILETAALIVVIGRRRRAGPILLKSWAIGLFFFYAALSVAWSDYPVVTVKHWIKGIGDVLMVLIVLTEPSVGDAIQRLVTRIGFVILPLSVLFIKYYPLLGRALTLGWTMEPVGVATQKNGLGQLCLILGLGLFWRLRKVYNDRKDPKRRQRLLGLCAVVPMIVWLLWMSNSMTSICALSMATAMMFLSKRPVFRRRPALVHLFVVGVLGLTTYALFFQSSGSLVQGLGRDRSLTGRADDWPIILAIPNNRLVGVGYESFWLGARLEKLWTAFPGFLINEAHNGYIEIFLNLGSIGVVLLGVMIATGYRNVISSYRRDPEIGSLKIAFLLATTITGFTEASFRMMGPLWIVFLLASAAAPVVAARKGSRRGRLERQTSGAQEPVATGSEFMLKGC
jgi:exopolysaccharide production protein ExoQ